MREWKNDGSMTSRGFIRLAAICLAASSARAEPAPRHVVLIVWDGMRADFATEQYAPTLAKLARTGVRFRNHHSVYPTATNVNGAALATGCYPERNSICANLEFRPGIDPRHPFDTSEPEAMKRGDETSGGKYLPVPTFVERLRDAGKTVALAGTKSVALLFDRHSDWMDVPMRNRPLTIFAGAPIKTEQRDLLIKLLGPFFDDPRATAAQRNEFATRALTEFLWRDGVADFSLLWLSEPDMSEHNFAPGSPQAVAAIKSVDFDLDSILSALEKKHARDSTDVLVVSDHGFSTIRRSIDLVALLNTAGFHAGTSLPPAPKPGDVVAAGNAGTVLFYVHEHDRETTQRLVDWLQHSDFAGTIFTRDKADGTFPLRAIHLATADSPDVVMAFRSYAETNQFGAPGLIDADWNRPAGEGTHATLAVTDIHNIFIAAGPDFRSAFEDDAPTGNIDIAPTVLHLLGIEGNGHFDGRIVTEALQKRSNDAIEVKQETLTAAHNEWQQVLKTSRVGETIYFDPAAAPTNHHAPITDH